MIVSERIKPLTLIAKSSQLTLQKEPPGILVFPKMKETAAGEQIKWQVISAALCWIVIS